MQTPIFYYCAAARPFFHRAAAALHARSLRALADSATEPSEGPGCAERILADVARRAPGGCHTPEGNLAQPVAP